MQIKNYFFEDYWSIGILNQSIRDLIHHGLKEEKLEVLTVKGTSFYLADPCWNETLDQNEFLCEKFDYPSQIGTIARVIYEDGKLQITPFIEEDWHMSFPFLFESKMGSLIIPEASESGKLFAYERANLEKEVLIDQALVDPVIIEKNEKFWLFAGDANKSPNSSLFLFSSEDGKKWIPCNEGRSIKKGLRGSRMAGGIVTIENELYRFGQDCSKTYGGGIVIYKIEELSESNYREVEVRHLLPPESYRGLHTLNVFGDKVLVDLKRTHFSMVKPFYRLKNKMRQK